MLWLIIVYRKKRKMVSIKLIGYGISGVGLVAVAFNKTIASLPLISSLGAKAVTYSLVGGIALVVVGIALVMGEGTSGKVKQAATEVPIYEGEGKKRKIVGYRKA